MQDLQTYVFEKQEVRMIEKENEPWFVGKDVADILGYSETNAMTRRLDDEDFMSTKMSGMNMKSTIINESGLYAAIIGSKLPNAKKFKRWVTSEVLPSIRKHGMYATAETVDRLISDPDTAIKLLETIKQEREQRLIVEQQVKELQPKALFADAVTTSHTSILVGDLAKLLRQNDVHIGQNRLFAWLRENGFLINRKGESWNMPTQRSMDMSLFEVKELTHHNPDGSIRISKTTKVTGKGQVYFINKFVKVKQEA